MPSENDKLFVKGKNYCFTLLKVRQRSQYELGQRLKQKRYPAGVVRSLISYFKGLDLIDDRQFAHDWVRMRLSRNFGPHRIAFELRQKGIAETIIAGIIKKTGQDVNEETKVDEIAQKQFFKYRHLKHEIAQRRIYGYLLRRGFSENIIQKIVRSYDTYNI